MHLLEWVKLCLTVFWMYCELFRFPLCCELTTALKLFNPKEVVLTESQRLGVLDVGYVSIASEEVCC